MYRAAARILARPDEAEDACQEALVAAFSSRVYDSDRPFGPWLFGILNKVCLKRLRTLRRRREVPIEVEPASGGEPLPALSGEEDQAKLRAALDALEPRDRFLVVARFYERRSNVEIARELGMTPGAVGVALFRALEKLRRRANAPSGDPPHEGIDR